MNKPNKIKILMKVKDSYCKKILEIFNTDQFEDHSHLYGRENHFKNVKCNFVVNRFKIEDQKKFEEFMYISKNLLKELENLYGIGEFYNIQIAKMQGGGKILPHIDAGLGFVFSHRIHIPLITNENVIFKVDNENFYLSSGYIYEINNLKEHSVINNNSLDYFRIHIIFDYMSSEYVPFLNKNNKSLSFNYENNKH